MLLFLVSHYFYLMLFLQYFLYVIKIYINQMCERLLFFTLHSSTTNRQTDRQTLIVYHF